MIKIFYERSGYTIEVPDDEKSGNVFEDDLTISVSNFGGFVGALVNFCKQEGIEFEKMAFPFEYIKL